ncbi:N-acetylmuramoyl-L-alanine amidase [Sphingomonas sp. SM33]|uniref:N-acetylmuramoyl-L-alanine amidase n=1 Tax=Sphingomonas telluris TaxID=2907998 RepID=A0ABS9VIF2_9SPHN|nr:N-acetylmuramoyl-L-alanine amidase [Sphingomonas telluris]MCH8614738.1 N-acetylmuramoyl-L-alanine amidase [Sphingomonas telluris]
MTEAKRRRAVAGAAFSLAGVLIAIMALGTSQRGDAASDAQSRALLGEARPNSVTVELSPAVGEVKLTEAKTPGRPIVVIDPGHGGRDPGAPGVSGNSTEKDLTLTLARELRAELAERGRVRVALTREDDRYLTLDQRAEIARKLGASVYLSLHIDSAPNPLARGATIYSLSDVASDSEAARLAARENKAGDALSSAADGSVRGMLSDLALREQMNASASLAERLVRKSSGRYLLRPEPHRFADFRVLRRAEVPAVLFEAGYISNADDEALLLMSDKREQIVVALAQAIEADVASRTVR